MVFAFFQLFQGGDSIGKLKIRGVLGTLLISSNQDMFDSGFTGQLV